MRLLETLESYAQIAQIGVVTHRIYGVHIAPPYHLVALREIPLFVVLSGDVADALDAQKFIFVRFMLHVPKIFAIFATLSTVLAAVPFRMVAFAFLMGSSFRKVRRSRLP